MYFFCLSSKVLANENKIPPEPHSYLTKNRDMNSTTIVGREHISRHLRRSLNTNRYIETALMGDLRKVAK